MMCETFHCFNVVDIVSTFNYKKHIPISKKLARAKYGNDRHMLSLKIVGHTFKLILNDVIFNNCTFYLPLPSRKKAWFQLLSVTDDDLKFAIKKGAFLEQDMLKTNFTAYKPVFYWEINGKRRKINIVLKREEKKKFIQHVNNGGVTTSTTIKTVRDYIPILRDAYPDIPESGLLSLLKISFSSLFSLVRSGQEVVISSNKFKIWYLFGSSFLDKDAAFKFKVEKYIEKMRLLFRKKNNWDGYYYFGLNDERYKEYFANKKGRLKRKITFENIYITKVKEECFARISNTHFFRLVLKGENGTRRLLDKLTTRNVEEIAVRDFFINVKYLNEQKGNHK